MFDRIVEGHTQMDPMFNKECACVLAKRGVKQLEDGSYQFTRDRRVIAVRERHKCWFGTDFFLVPSHL